jgi:membrane protein DedA with SNARE-associated domain
MPIALQFFLQYGYLILFAWVLVEQLGLPAPAVPLLLMVGTLSANPQDEPASGTADCGAGLRSE